MARPHLFQRAAAGGAVGTHDEGEGRAQSGQRHQQRQHNQQRHAVAPAERTAGTDSGAGGTDVFHGGSYRSKRLRK